MTKYVVRDGFVVVLQTKSADGKVHDKNMIGGEPVDLDDETAALHLHKLELADPKARAAALKAEQDRKISTMATADPATLIKQLVAALASVQQSAPVPPAPASTPPTL
jgi:hypothetical protein